MSIGSEGNRDTVRTDYSQELLAGVDFFAWPDQSFRVYFATSIRLRKSLCNVNQQVGKITGRSEPEYLDQVRVAKMLNNAIMLRALPIMDAGQTESAVSTFPPFFRMSPDNCSIALFKCSVATLPFSAVVEKCSSICGLVSEGCLLLLT